MSEERLTEVEIKVAYLEHTLGELDAVVRDIGNAVEALRREVGRLRQAEVDGREKPANEKPPHY